MPPMRAALVSLALASASLACSRGGERDTVKPDEARDDEASKKPSKKKPLDDELSDPCGADAKAPTWKLEKTSAKAPPIDLERPVFASRCKVVAEDLNALLAKERAEGRAEYEKQWRESKGETWFNPEAWTLEDKCKPEHVSARVVSLSCTSYTFTNGAHGIGGTYGEAFVLERRKVRKIELADLFADAGWKKAIAKRLLPKINAQKSTRGLPSTEKDLEEALSVFVLRDAAVHFYFGPYVLGSYAEGEYDAELAFTDIDDLLAKDGPISKMPRAK